MRYLQHNSLHFGQRCSLEIIFFSLKNRVFKTLFLIFLEMTAYIVSVLGQDEGYTDKYTSLPELLKAKGYI